MNGLELCVRFSYITNTLRFCGPEEAATQFLQYIEKKDNAGPVEASLKRFEGLLPYLSTIAEKNGEEPFDHDVVEAYWIGNKLLDACDDADMKSCIQKLMQRGLPKSWGEKKIAQLPSGFRPHHDFNVFYVGVGMLTGSVERTMQNMDNCRISWGKVLDVHPGQLIVSTQQLEKKYGDFVLVEATKNAMFLPVMLPDVQKGDHVALHWGFAAVELTTQQSASLKKYTKNILSVMNAQKD
ncbi:MAG: DUF6390 family protein [Nanoarchaeota archaeon]